MTAAFALMATAATAQNPYLPLWNIFPTASLVCLKIRTIRER